MHYTCHNQLHLISVDIICNCPTSTFAICQVSKCMVRQARASLELLSQSFPPQNFQPEFSPSEFEVTLLLLAKSA